MKLEEIEVRIEEIEVEEIEVEVRIEVMKVEEIEAIEEMKIQYGKINH